MNVFKQYHLSTVTTNTSNATLWVLTVSELITALQLLDAE